MIVKNSIVILISLDILNLQMFKIYVYLMMEKEVLVFRKHLELSYGICNNKKFFCNLCVTKIRSHQKLYHFPQGIYENSCLKNHNK